MTDHGTRRRERQPQEPRSVEQISKAAQSYDYNASIKATYWLRSATALLREADIYEREGDDEQTYLLLFRHAHLILTNLPEHPDLKDKSVREHKSAKDQKSVKEQLLQAQSEVNKNLKKLTVLKPRISGRYDHYQEIRKEREARKAEAFREKNTSQDTRLDHQEEVYSSASVTHQLQAHENQELAVQLAHREFSRRAAQHEARQRGSGSSEFGRQSSKTSTESGFRYPSVPSHRATDTIGPRKETLKAFPAPDPPISATVPLIAPPIPAKPFQPSSISLPPRPDKVLVESAKVPAEEAATEPAITFAPNAYLENGTPLRTLFLPPTLRTTFLRLAYSNTKSNLETCAFLAGTLIANALFVSKLIVPAQTATSDTCEMTNESQLFDYVDSEADLMILGWIHTHPTQTCFMSSRDLHTHSGYQMMLAESVAIVCAPSQGDTSHGGDWGVYRLTDPPGKKTILGCQKPGIFHPHDVENIYTDALSPGHVVETKGLNFDVVDLRE